ncbi:MAG: hypothetical protein ACLFPQ_03890 [Candidatus Woesearchaeota archaeon]
MVKKLKHDRYLEDLCDQIKENYDAILTNVPIFSDEKKHSSKRRIIAEIDILAVKENKFDIYEVKCSYRIIKAKHQLKKIKKLLPKVENTFFFCGDSGIIESVLC